MHQSVEDPYFDFVFVDARSPGYVGGFSMRDEVILQQAQEGTVILAVFQSIPVFILFGNACAIPWQNYWQGDCLIRSIVRISFVACIAAKVPLAIDLYYANGEFQSSIDSGVQVKNLGKQEHIN